MSGERCDGCKFWEFIDNEKSTIDDYEGIGKCRRFPPSVPSEVHQSEDHPNTAGWHWTVENDWCGEFQPAKQPETPKTPINKSGLAPRTAACLIAEGVETVEDALEKTDKELLKFPNFGRTCLKDLRDWAIRNQPASKSTT